MRAVIILSIVVAVAIICLLFWLGRSPPSLPGRDTSDLSAAAVPKHIKALASSDADKRFKAARALWQIGKDAKEATPALLAAMKDKDPKIREMAARALGLTSQGTSEAIPALVEALKDPHAEVRATAAASLAEIWSGEHESQKREPGVGKPPKIQLHPSLEAAARPAIPILKKVLADANALVRAKAAAALGEAGSLAQPAVEDLIQIVQKDPDDEACLRATIALGNIGPGAESAVPVLLANLKHHKSSGIRVNSASSLGMINTYPEKVVPALVEAHLKDDDPDVRVVALMALQMFGENAIPLARPSLERARNVPADQWDPAVKERAKQLLNFLDNNLKLPHPSGPSSPRLPGSRNLSPHPVNRVGAPGVRASGGPAKGE